MRKTPFVVGEYYHVYNRGVDKRLIFNDENDLSRFFQTMQEFNTRNPVGGIYQRSFQKKNKIELVETTPLVQFVVYCLNPNHFHFLFTPLVEKGVEKYMQRVGNGYTKYFNNKYKRSGVLFQGKFKSKHINSNVYLLHLSVYINGNNQLRHPMSKLWPSMSSLNEYLGLSSTEFCSKGIVLDQFTDIEAYKKFFEGTMEDIIYRKEIEKEAEFENNTSLRHRMSK